MKYQYDIDQIKVGPQFEQKEELCQWVWDNQDILEELREYDLSQDLANKLTISKLLEAYKK